MEDDTPLKLHWTFGFSRDVAYGVHSLCDGCDNCSALFYPSSNTGVIYDYSKRSQNLLQGHCNPISCVALSDDKKLIVSADAGTDSLLVVWTTDSGTPIKTVLNPHPHGIVGVDLSSDGRFLGALSAHSDVKCTSPQQILIWDVANPGKTIFC